MATTAGVAKVPFQADMSGLMSSAAGAVGDVGNLFAKLVPLAFVAGIGAAIAKTIDLGSIFQKTTDQLAANMGVSVKQAAAIGNAFLATGGQTTFTAQEMLAAFAPVSGQLEFMNGKALTVAQSLAFMRVAMALAEATGTDLGSTTKDLASIMQAFGIPISDASHASDVLYNSAKALGVPIDSLTTSLQRARTQAGAAAPSLQDLSAFLLDLAAHGESGRGAMSLLNTALTGIEAPTKAVTKAQRDLGVSFINSKGQLLPFNQIIAQGHTLIEGMGNAQAVATLKSVGFGGASSKLVDLMQAGAPAFQNALDATNKQGTASAAASEATSGLGDIFDKLKTRVIDAATSFGMSMLPAVTGVLGWINKPGLQIVGDLVGILGKLIGAFGGLGPVLALVVGGLVAWGAAMGVAEALKFVTFITEYIVQAGLAAGVTGGWASVQAALNAAFLANPIGAIIIGLVALVAGILLVVTHLTLLKAIVLDVWGFIWSKISGVVGAIVAVFKLTPFGFLITHLTEIKNMIGAVFGWIVSTISAAWTAISNDAAAAWNGVVNIIKGAVNLIIGIIDTILGGVNKVTGAVPVFGKNLAIPLIPKWTAAGGIFTSPTVIGVGEAGPEAVLNRPQLAQVMGIGGGAGNRRAMITNTYHVALYGTDEANTKKFIALIEQNNAEVARANELAA